MGNIKRVKIEKTHICPDYFKMNENVNWRKKTENRAVKKWLKKIMTKEMLSMILRKGQERAADIGINEPILRKKGRGKTNNNNNSKKVATK